MRSTLGTPASFDPNTLRLLTDATDTSACNFLKSDAQTTPEARSLLVRWTYYTAGGFYFAAAYRADAAGENALGPGGLFVYGPGLTFQGLYRM